MTVVTKLTYPGPALPALPSLEFEIPEDWHVVAEPRALVAVVASVVPPIFAANVVATVTRHASSYIFSAAVADFERGLSNLPEVRMLPPIEREGDVGESALRALAYVDPDAGTLAQVHLLGRVEIAEFADVVHVVGTCGGDRLDDDLSLIADVLRSFKMQASASKLDP